VYCISTKIIEPAKRVVGILDETTSLLDYNPYCKENTCISYRCNSYDLSVCKAQPIVSQSGPGPHQRMEFISLPHLLAVQLGRTQNKKPSNLPELLFTSLCPLLLSRTKQNEQNIIS